MFDYKFARQICVLGISKLSVIGPCCALVVGRYFAGSPRTPSCHSGNHPYKIQIILPEIYVFKSNKYTIRGWLNNSYGDDINARY